MRPINRRRPRAATAAAALAVLAVVAAGCAPSESLAQDDDPAAAANEADAGDDPAAADAEPFTVGLLVSSTGFAANMGSYMQQGWDLYWEENGSVVGNFEVRTIVEDDASNPETALTKAQRLVTEEDVDVVVGPILANNGLAVADYLDQQGVANIAQTAADDLTQRERNPHVLRIGALAGSQATFPGGQWAHDEGHRTAATICPDYAFGWENCGGFVSAFTDAGGEVVDQLWYPATATDMSTYVTELIGSGADVVFAGTSGGNDGANFIRAGNDFDLFNQVPVLLNCCGADQTVLSDMGEGAVGIQSVSYFAAGSEAPGTAAFTEAYHEQYGNVPSVYAAASYTAAEVLAEVLDEASSAPTGEDLVAAMRAVSLEDSAMGTISFDEYNNMVGPVFIREVEMREDGALWNTVDETFEGVSQFWTYSPEEYLDNPPFSQSVTGQ